MTGGEGGIANVHIVKITMGMPHLNEGYGDVYFVLAGTGTITLGQDVHPLRPSSVAVVEPTGTHLQSMQLTVGAVGTVSPWVRF